MKSNTFDRRHAIAGLTGLSLASLLSHASPQDLQISAEQAGEVHWEMLQRISAALKGQGIGTRQGLSNLLAFLVEQGIIGEQDRAVLERMLDAIFKSASADEIMKKLEQLEKETAKALGEIAHELVRIAHTSTEYARKQYREHPRVVQVISADISGGITGASTGNKIGGKKGAIAGLVVGAVGSSAWAALSSTS